MHTIAIVIFFRLSVCHTGDPSINGSVISILIMLYTHVVSYYYYKCQDLSDAITTVAGALYKVYQ